LAAVKFQEGPLKIAERNGIMVDDLLLVCRRKLSLFQEGPFPCEENAEALRLIDAALRALAMRTKDRESRGVEGLSEA
jgi:hypothetical protein